MGLVTNPGTSPISDLPGRTVLLRADFSAGVSPELADTVSRLAAHHARVAIVSGFGAPGGDINPALSLARFRRPIELASGVRVTFVRDCVGPVAESGLDAVPYGEAALMENLRFHADERRDSRNFAIRLSVLGDFFALTGPRPDRPIGWLAALSSLLPAPEGTLPAISRKEH